MGDLQAERRQRRLQLVCSHHEEVVAQVHRGARLPDQPPVVHRRRHATRQVLGEPAGVLVEGARDRPREEADGPDGAAARVQRHHQRRLACGVGRRHAQSEPVELSGCWRRRWHIQRSAAGLAEAEAARRSRPSGCTRSMMHPSATSGTASCATPWKFLGGLVARGGEHAAGLGEHGRALLGVLGERLAGARGALGSCAAPR